MMIYRSALFLALAAVGSLGSIEAETVTWDGGQDPAGMQWGVKENWSPEKLPNAGDRVVLPVGAKPTLNVESTIKELVVGELGVGRVATIVGADQTLNVSSLTLWNNGVLTGTGAMDLNASTSFGGRAHFDEWIVTLNGSSTAVNTSFRTGRSLTIGGTLSVGANSSIGGTSVGELILSGMLTMNAQSGQGDPPGSRATAGIDSVLFNHQGTLRADRGKWVIGSRVLSAGAATTATGPMGEIEFRGGGQFGLSAAHRFEPAPNTRIRLTGVSQPYQLGTLQNASAETPVLIESTTIQGGMFNGGRWEFNAEASTGIQINGGRFDWLGGPIRGALDVGANGELVIGARSSGRAIELLGRGTIAGQASQFRNVTLATNVVVQGRWTLHNAASIPRSPQGKIQVAGELKHTADTATQRSELGVLVEVGSAAAKISNEGGILSLANLFAAGKGGAYTFIVNEDPFAGAPAKTILTGVNIVSGALNEGRLTDTLFAFQKRGGVFELATDVRLTGNTVIGVQGDVSNVKAQVVVRKGTVELLGAVTSPDRLDGESSLNDRVRNVLGSLDSPSASFIIDDASTDLSKPTLLFASHLGTVPTFDGDVQWNRGIITGTETLMNTMSLTLSGTGVKRLTRTFEVNTDDPAVLLNQGATMSIVGTSRLELGASTRMQNGLEQPFTRPADFFLKGDGDVVLASGVTNAEFVNNGNLVKTMGNGTSLISVPFSNAGSVACRQGTLRFSGPVSQVKLIDEQTGEIELDGKWSAFGGNIQFAQNKVLKLKKVTNRIFFANGGEFLNSLGKPLIDFTARFISSGEVTVEKDAALEVDRIEQARDSGRPTPRLAVIGGLKGKELEVKSGTVEVAPGGKLEFPTVLIEPDKDEFPLVIIDGQLVPRADTELPPLVRVGGGLFGGNGTVGSPLELGPGATLSPGKSPGTLRTAQVTFEPGSRYRWEVADWSGLAGEQTDLVLASGDVSIGATAENPLIIEVVPLTSLGESGAAVGWNPAVQNRWVILESSTGISEFSPDAVQVTAPANLGGEFVVQSDGQRLNLVYRATEDPFQAWQKVNFSAEDLLDSEKVGEDADFDGDGIPNSLEFVGNTDPTSPDSEAVLTIANSPVGLRIQFQLLEDTAPFSVVLETSSDLSEWGAGVRQDPGASPMTLNDQELPVELTRADGLNTVIVSPSVGEDLQFFRLRVERFDSSE